MLAPSMLVRRIRITTPTGIQRRSNSGSAAARSAVLPQKPPPGKLLDARGCLFSCTPPASTPPAPSGCQEGACWQLSHARERRAWMLGWLRIRDAGSQDLAGMGYRIWVLGSVGSASCRIHLGIHVYNAPWYTPRGCIPEVYTVVYTVSVLYTVLYTCGV